ncbi:hypothetical protein MKW92_039061, partial [Papaver armeniacum]
MANNAAFDELNRKIDELARTQKESHQRQDELSLKHADLLKKVDQHYEQPSAKYLQSIRELFREYLDEQVGVSAGHGPTLEDSNGVLDSTATTIICDSNSQTPTPDDIGSQMFESISRGIEEESLDFEVVPSFLFEEKEDSVNSKPQEEKSLTTRSNSIGVLHFLSEGFESKVVRDFIRRNQGIIDEQYSRYLKEFSSLDSKTNGMNYFYLHLDDIRSLFDRGKYPIVLSISYENLVNPWILSLGYQSDFRYIPLVVILCVNDAASLDERMLLVKMTVRIRHVLLLLCRVIEMEKVLEPQ